MKCRENEIAENEILCILFQIEKKKDYNKYRIGKSLKEIPYC